MSSHGGATTTLWGQTSWPYTSADTVISAGQSVDVFIGWESTDTISSVTDDAGQTYTHVVTLQNPGGPSGAIYRKVNHPGGAAVNVSVSGSGGAGPSYGGVTVMPMNGGGGGDDGTPTSAQGEAAASFSCGDITTTAVGYVVQFLVGYQATTGVVAGGTPTFTRDTASEANNGGTQTSFVQYLLSGSAQTVSPAASWGAIGSQYVFMAAAFKDSGGGGGGGQPPRSMNQYSHRRA
ncbi:MAG: hypothetical protein KIT60_06975 [Burkholderiaceae bacterium]|nr:hypothetical protein [Burkholderiaceae bacterium]